MHEAALIASHTLAVCRRQYLVWRKIIWPSLSTNVANPVLFLFAFGFGLGAVIDDMGGLDYLAYVVPGMMAYSAMFAASFETTIGSFARFNMQKTWDAVLATPVSLIELLLGEAFWAACKAMISATSRWWARSGAGSARSAARSSACPDLPCRVQLRRLRPRGHGLCPLLGVLQLLLHLLGDADVRVLRRVLRRRPLRTRHAGRCCR